jgi:cytochrome c peroxidase
MKTKIPTALLACSLTTLLVAGAGGALAADSEGLTPIQDLGRQIFFDKKLSVRRNQSCATCHVPEAGWVGDDSKINIGGAVYEGSIKGRFGDRKPPSSAYATLAPIFYADFGNRLLGDNVEELAIEPLFVGGNFWDGRATGWELGNPAADQAQGPFLNPVEQALPDAACVVYRVCDGDYGDLFQEVWGPNVCTIAWPKGINGQCSRPDGVVSLSPQDRQKVDNAYDRVALAVAAFEGSAASNAFTSKIDAHRAGLYEFTAQEDLGRRIFQGKGQCVACHVGAGGPGAPPPLFTDFTYDNLGVPKNPVNPFLLANPDWTDPGLGGFLGTVAFFADFADTNLGKQKVPTLRNVALGSCEAKEATAQTAKGSGDRGKCVVKAYMHNGYFKSLKQVVHFYNTRDTKPVCPGDLTADQAIAADCWPAPEVAENVNTDEMGDLGLTEAEEDALVAFMQAMSDGFWVK